MYDSSLSCGTGTSIKGSRAKLVLWAKTFTFSEMNEVLQVYFTRKDNCDKIFLSKGQNYWAMYFNPILKLSTIKSRPLQITSLPKMKTSIFKLVFFLSKAIFSINLICRKSHTRKLTNRQVICPTQSMALKKQLIKYVLITKSLLIFKFI